MKIITQANQTRNRLVALHCAAVFVALGVIGGATGDGIGTQHAQRLNSTEPALAAAQDTAQDAALHTAQFAAQSADPYTAARPDGNLLNLPGNGQASTDPSQRIILKSDDHHIDVIISLLETLSGSVVKLVRSMSDSAHVVAVTELESNKSAKKWIDHLTATGFIEYGQLDSPVKINASIPAQTGSELLTRAAPFNQLPNDLLYADQWMMGSPTIVPASLNLERAWEITTGSSDVVVAVIDTGVLFDHPDLSNRLLPGYDFVAGLNDAPETIMPVHNADTYLKSNDGDGRDLDASDPGDGVDQAFRDYMLNIGYDCPLVNSTWHGTAMASLLAANGNDETGMTGIDWHLNVLPVRAIGRCGGNRSDLLDSIRWAAGVDDPNLPPNPNPARIINLSLGIDDVCGPADQQAINDAVNAGAIIVAAVGNHGRNTDEVPSAPADCRHVIGVSAVNSDGSRASYSNFGDDADIAAPGGDIGLSDERKVVVAANAGSTQRAPGSSHRYTTGTSVAAPMVSGVLSLMLSVNPDLNNAQLESLLYSSTRPFMYVGGGTTQCRQSVCGVGMLDAHAAVVAALDSIDNPPQIGAATASDDFIITTGSENFGCSIVGGAALGGSNSNPAKDPSWLLLIAAAYLLRRHTRRSAQHSALR